MKPKFLLGQRVYAVLAGERGIVTGIMHRPHGIMYYVTWADRSEDGCYDIELSDEPVKDFAD